MDQPKPSTNTATIDQIAPELTIIIPAFNERVTLPNILGLVARTLPGVSREIIVVDDGSNDGTRQWLEETFPAALGTTADYHFESGALLPIGVQAAGPIALRVLLHDINRGKGAAIRTGLAAASKDIIVIQDADLEYDPQDWGEMFALFERGVADAVLGSRFYGRPHRVLYFYHLLGNKLITYLFNLLFNQTLSDLETCYKMFRRQLIDGVALVSEDFGIEVELAALFAANSSTRTYELGVSYFGRTYAEGKKIGWRDGVKALWYVVKFRIETPRNAARRIR